MHTKLKLYLMWALPFCTFCIGYFAMASLFKPQKIVCPQLTGVSLDQALVIASTYAIPMQVVKMVSHAAYPPLTVIGQTPNAHEIMKKNQILFCVVTKPTEVVEYKKYSNQPYKSIVQELKTVPTTVIQHALVHSAPENTCIAQFPHAHKPLDQKTHIFMASKGPELYIMPDLAQSSCSLAQTLLLEKNLRPLIIHTTPINAQHTCKKCIVRAQTPPAKTYIQIGKPPMIQLLVECMGNA